MAERKYDLEDRLLEYAVEILWVVGELPKNRIGDHIGGQLLGSGTSPYANHGEAQAAESVNDFIHKMRVCLKELRESKRWLRLIQHMCMVTDANRLNRLLRETEELIMIFATSIRTAKKGIK